MQSYQQHHGVEDEVQEVTVVGVCGSITGGHEDQSDTVCVCVCVWGGGEEQGYIFVGVHHELYIICTSKLTTRPFKIF